MRTEIIFDNGDTIRLNTSTGGCVCRNRRQRLAAKKQAYAILDSVMWIPANDTGVHISTPRKPSVLTLDNYLGEKNVCRECTRIYLQLLEDARGEQIAECVISSLYPLGSASKSKK
ncbi:MAG: hypothetical protein RR221_07545 [Alistipes sp.]